MKTKRNINKHKIVVRHNEYKKFLFKMKINKELGVDNRSML